MTQIAKWILALSVMVFNLFVSIGQTISIGGKLQGLDPQDPIPFAHVYVQGTTFGTLTNIDGEYVLNLPPKFAQDSIVFSCVGFETQVIAVSQLDGSDGLISLTESETTLTEVIVSSLSAADIWERAIKAKAKNFSTDRFRLTGFYRTTFQEDGQFSRLLEAAVHIHGDRFIKKRAKIEYLQIRKSKDLRDHKWKIYDGYLEHLVNQHPLRWIPDFLNPRGMSKYDFQIADIKYQDADCYYVVDAVGSQKGMHDAQMLIKAETFEIYRITILWKPENAGDFSWAWEQKDDARFFCDEQTSIYEYTSYNGGMVPKRSSWHRKGRVISNENGKTIFRTESIDELLITNIDSESYAFENPIEDQNIYEMGEYFTYKKNFWDTFNRPVDSEYFKRAKQKLESHQPLEDQFKENSGLKVQ